MSYEQIGASIWLKDDQKGLIPQIDTVILDIDGVILDVSSSFRVAISQTVQLYLTRERGFGGDSVLILPSESQLFKQAGGFNNDWDLTRAVILFYLTKAELLQTDHTAILRENGQSLVDFTTGVGRAGGGLHGVMAVLFPLLSKEQRQRVEKGCDRVRIEELFQELYGGVDYCKRLYGHKPKFNKRSGLLNEEKVMLDQSILIDFIPKVGILTGRTKKETEVGLEKAGLKGIIPWKHIIFDTGESPEMRKPRPGSLLDLAETLEAKVALYVGDVMDDLLTVKNANLERTATAVFLSAIIVSPLRRDYAELFRKEGADIVSLDVNKALKELIARRR